MITIIGEYTKEDTIYATRNSKEEIDKAVQGVIESRITAGRMRVIDKEKLEEVKKKVMEDIKETNHPIRWLLKRILTGK